jgi:cytosine-specific methyltransferase
MISTYAKLERTQDTIYLRLDANEPLGTVVNVRKSMWIHPTLDRAVTVREVARLQSSLIPLGLWEQKVHNFNKLELQFNRY